ncbi:MAG: trigger factor [Methylotenera sp.]|uniref:trigger factor n=1 Tax=Methylotenera sp. TaxID=2051956 RepID=UPI00182C60BF|nr:trigger factor [Methylotenera sp.]NOU25731.1 trigger factor [Methylotenera sp.]
MALNVETLSKLERRITISVPLQPLQAQIHQRLAQMSRTAKFAGFRPGKAPLGLVNQHYGDQVRDEVYSGAVEKSFGDAVDEAKLRVAGFPNIEHKPFGAASETLEYTATFEVFPEVVLGDLSKIKIERPVIEVSEADVKKTLDVLVKQRVNYVPVKRAAKKGDRINVTLKASIDGKEVESTGDKGIDLVLGDAGRVESFDDQLTGGKAGSSKQFEITYPADHNPAQLAGKTVGYDVTFVSVSEPKLPEIDAEFAKSLGIEDGDVAKMKAEVTESLKQEVAKRVSAKLKEQVFQALVESADFEIPRVLLGSEINRMMETTTQNLKQRGADLSAIKLEPAMFEDQAKRSTKLRLILGELINSNGLHANADQIRAMVDVFSQSFERPSDVVTWYYADPKRLDEPSALATEENAVAWVLSKAKVTDKKVKFDDLMGNA